MPDHHSFAICLKNCPKLHIQLFKYVSKPTAWRASLWAGLVGCSEAAVTRLAKSGQTATHQVSMTFCKSTDQRSCLPSFSFFDPYCMNQTNCFRQVQPQIMINFKFTAVVIPYPSSAHSKLTILMIEFGDPVMIYNKPIYEVLVFDPDNSPSAFLLNYMTAHLQI